MPRIVDHDAKRSDLAEVVWRVVGRRGIDAATLREIAAEAQCSTGSLVHYFGDKDGILLFALREAGARSRNRIEQIARELDGLVALRAALHEALPLDGGRREEWGVWLAFWGRCVANAQLADAQAERHREWQVLVRRLVLAAQRAGEIRQDVAAVREADTLLSLVDGIGLQAMLDPERLPPERQVSLLDRYLQTLATPLAD